MLALIRNLAGGLSALGVIRACRGDDYSRDPLAHPTLDRMNLVELADLPACELRARGRA